MTLREQIAIKFYDTWINGNDFAFPREEKPVHFPFDSLPEYYQEEYYAAADAILSLIREHIKSIGVVKRGTPDNRSIVPSAGWDVAYEAGQEAMKNSILKELER